MSNPAGGSVSIQHALEAGKRHHAAGQLAQAGAILPPVLALDPNHAQALHLLGVVAGLVGRMDAAAELISRAAQISPSVFEYQLDLATVYQKMGLSADSIAAARAAVALRPTNAQAYNILGL